MVIAASLDVILVTEFMLMLGKTAGILVLGLLICLSSRQSSATRVNLSKPRNASPLVDAKAIIYVQLNTDDAARPGKQWAEFNDELQKRQYYLICFIADPKKWSLLTVGMVGPNASFRSDAGQALSAEKEAALGVKVDGQLALNDLSNVAVFSNSDLHPIAEALFAQAGVPLMSKISGSAYSVPKVLDYLLQVLYKETPVVRFDEDCLIDGNDQFQESHIFSVVHRALAIVRKYGSNGSYAFSSRLSRVSLL